MKKLPAAGATQAYAAWSLNPECRKSSASGGAAAEFYIRALEQGYWICGAEYGSDLRVVHTLTRDASAVERFKQSKYVSSDVCAVYEQIRSRLEDGENVLMISLPCKIAGLLGYLGKRYDNLLTVDIVCHGTPSAKLLKDHIDYVAPGPGNYKLRFRQDNEFMFLLEKENAPVYRKIGRTDTYLAAFLEGLSYRPSCYQCSYASPKRISDITICDFWGLGTEIPFDHPYTGAISAVLVNSENGRRFFEECRERLFTEERPVTEAIRGNAQLNAPTSPHPKRAEFEKLCTECGFEAAVSMLLGEEMNAAKKEIQRRLLRSRARKLAGLFLKRYRG